MNTLQKIIEHIGSGDDILLADGFDDAVIGIDWNFRAIYSSELAIRILMKRDGLSRTDAIEFMEFNVWCAHVGSQTPLWMMDSMIRHDIDSKIHELHDEADELINCGNSNEISFGRGMKRVLDQMQLEKFDWNDDENEN